MSSVCTSLDLLTTTTADRSIVVAYSGNGHFVSKAGSDVKLYSICVAGNPISLTTRGTLVPKLVSVRELPTTSITKTEAGVESTSASETPPRTLYQRFPLRALGAEFVSEFFIRNGFAQCLPFLLLGGA